MKGQFHGLPWCAVCQKPVDKLVSWYEPEKRWTMYEVQCHGEYERTPLTQEQFALLDSIRFGAAFTSQNLTAHELARISGQARD